jgi:single-strand DNA-binding protein
MASDMNTVNLIGRMTADPELKYTPNGKSVLSFSMANNYSYKSGEEKRETVSFFNCVAWGKAGELIAQYVKKGDRLAVSGRLQQRSWETPGGEKRYAVEVVVENFQFLQQRPAGSGQQEPPPPPQNFDQASPFRDDDVPF